VVFVHQGKVIARGTPEEVIAGFDEHSMEDVFIKVARGGDVMGAPGGEGGGA
jgi:ABC-type Na+ transport system ATPase subunit NatA